MEDVDIEARRQQLLQLKSELLELEGAADESSDAVVLDQSRVGRLSRMDAMQAQQMSLESHRRRQQQLVAIEGALRRIETGDYGDCFVCGSDIGTPRLQVNPASTRCMKCI